VHPQVKKLLELQKVDQEVASIRKDLDSLPAEESKRKKRLDEAELKAAEAKDKSIKAELESRTLEKAIKGSDEEIKKLNDRLNLVRNNAEYQATLFQIESVKKDRDATQEECLRLLDQIEGLKAAAEQTAKAAADERKVFQDFLAEAQKLRQARAGEVAEVEQRRRATAEGIPPDLLADYTRLFSVRNGLAVCAVEKKFCQGCYTNITTNDVARLMGGTSIVYCDNCQRILYLNR
jgi:hypothetical protein